MMKLPSKRDRIQKSPDSVSERLLMEIVGGFYERIVLAYVESNPI